jgi:N-acetylglucosaminylphosphatidylinositol deacetylase
MIGNHDGIGNTRKKELVASCKAFGMRESQVTLVDHP